MSIILKRNVWNSARNLLFGKQIGPSSIPLHQRPKIAESMEKFIKETEIKDELINVFTQLEVNKRLPEDKRLNCQQVLKEVTGFSLKKDLSSITESGLGLTLIGEAKEGSVVAVYPGTVYLPGDPSLLPSIRNDYMLRRSDGVLIDGKPTGLSKRIFLSCASRDTISDKISLCDSTWLTQESLEKPSHLFNLHNPLACGHYINHYPLNYEPNVMYFEFDFPSDFPLELRQYIPHVLYRQQDQTFQDGFPVMRSLVLIALKNLRNEELFSDYCFIGTETNKLLD